MTSRLIVDDERSHRFLRNDRDGGWHARTADQAIALLDKFSFSEVHLDHDLGQGEDGQVINVMPLVDELCRRAFEGEPYPARIFVHTQNPIGAESMMRSLKRFGYDVTRVALDDMRVEQPACTPPQLTQLDAAAEHSAASGELAGSGDIGISS